MRAATYTRRATIATLVHEWKPRWDAIAGCRGVLRHMRLAHLPRDVFATPPVSNHTHHAEGRVFLPMPRVCNTSSVISRCAWHLSKHRPRFHRPLLLGFKCRLDTRIPTDGLFGSKPGYVPNPTSLLKGKRSGSNRHEMGFPVDQTDATDHVLDVLRGTLSSTGMGGARRFVGNTRFESVRESFDPGRNETSTWTPHGGEDPGI